MRSQQVSLIPALKSDFGGSLLRSNAKVARPLHTKKSIHLVLKSKFAIGRHSLLAPKNISEVERIVRSQAKACGIKIYHFVNVGNHLHLVLQIKNRALYARFIRAISGLIARLVTGRERSKAKVTVHSINSTSPTKLKFWQARPFSRVVSWSREFKTIANYMNKNKIESEQIQKYFRPSIVRSRLTEKVRFKTRAIKSSPSPAQSRLIAFGFDHLIST